MEPSLTFQSYLKEIWRARRRIVGTTVAIAAVTAVVSLLLPKTYEATAQLIVLPSQFRSELANPPPEVQTCQHLLTNPSTLQQLHYRLSEARHALDKLTSHQPFSTLYVEGIIAVSAARIQIDTGCDPDVAQFVADLDETGLWGLADFSLEDLADMSLEDLIESLRAEVTEEKKTAIDIIYSPIIILHARGRTGRQAAMLANAWADVFLKGYGRLVRANLERDREFLARQTGQFRQARAKTQQEIQSIHRHYNVEFLQAQLEAAKQTYVQWRGELDHQRLQMDDETSQAMAQWRSRLANLEAAVAGIRKLIDDANSSITAAQAELALAQADDATYERYLSHTMQQLQEAELAVAHQGLDVKVASQAIAPEKKIWPQRTLMVAVMTVLGLFFSMVAVCMRLYLVTTGVWAQR